MLMSRKKMKLMSNITKTKINLFIKFFKNNFINNQTFIKKINWMAYFVICFVDSFALTWYTMSNKKEETNSLSLSNFLFLEKNII